MNNNVNCIQEDIYLYISMIQNLEIWKKTGMAFFFPLAVCFFITFFITSELYGGILLKCSSLCLYIMWEYVVVGSDECCWQKAWKWRVFDFAFLHVGNNGLL